MDGLYRELTAALEACGRPYEIVAVDDGSTDETFARLARLQASDYRLRVIRSAATSARPRPSPPALRTRAGATS